MQDRATTWLDERLEAEPRWTVSQPWDLATVADDAQRLLDRTSPASPLVSPAVEEPDVDPGGWLGSLADDSFAPAEIDIEVTEQDLAAVVLPAGAHLESSPLVSDDLAPADDTVGAEPAPARSGVVDPFDVMVADDEPDGSAATVEVAPLVDDDIAGPPADVGVTDVDVETTARPDEGVAQLDLDSGPPVAPTIVDETAPGTDRFGGSARLDAFDAFDAELDAASEGWSSPDQREPDESEPGGELGEPFTDDPNDFG